MKLSIWLCVTLLSANAAGADNPFAGSWNLTSVERRDTQGEWRSADGQFITNPVGLLMYDDTGHMSVHIMNPDRVATTANGPELTLEQLRERMRGYVAYFGTFDVNESEGYVVHHRLGHLNPSQVGVDAKRFYEFVDDKLTLTVAPGRNFRLTWQRLD